MIEIKPVVLVDCSPEAAGYSKLPDLSPEKLLAALEADRNKLNDPDFAASILFIDDTETARRVVNNALDQEKYDFVMIGAGVRVIPEPLIVFVSLVNTVHESARNAKICFNTNPLTPRKLSNVGPCDLHADC
ncbi:MAG: hypothetical protein ACI9UK_001245 [Candidatus Krumholzibacteriia bacterium]|jgi:hypothetical protein